MYIYLFWCMRAFRGDIAQLLVLSFTHWYSSIENVSGIFYKNIHKYTESKLFFEDHFCACVGYVNVIRTHSECAKIDIHLSFHCLHFSWLCFSPGDFMHLLVLSE